MMDESEYLEDLQKRLEAGETAAVKELQDARAAMDRLIEDIFPIMNEFLARAREACDILLQWWQDHPELADLAEQRITQKDMANE